MANDWFRCYAEWATDPKVQMLSEAMQRRLMMLFCARCSDVLVTFCDEELAFWLRISDAELQVTKAAFMAKGFVDDKWTILNWSKRQFVSDSSTNRTRQYRERLRTSQKRHSDNNVTNRDALDTDTDTDTDTEQNKANAEQRSNTLASSSNELPATPTSISDSLAETEDEHQNLKAFDQQATPLAHEDQLTPYLSPKVLVPLKTPRGVFPCAGKVAEWSFTDEDVGLWNNLYPAVDILQELRNAYGWIQGNQKKTARGMPRFIHSWLSRAQNKESSNGKRTTFATRTDNNLAALEACLSGESALGENPLGFGGSPSSQTKH